MSEFGDLLERLHDARHRWRTVQATVHHWSDAALTRQAWELYAEQARRDGSGVVVSARGSGEPPAPGLVAHPVERVWIDGPGGRFRTEREDRLRVRVGETWWHYDAAWGATSNEADPRVGSGGHDLEEELDPAPLIGLADLELAGDERVDGRSGRRVTVTPRRFPDQRYAPDFAFHAPGSSEFGWVVDDETGVLLRVEVRLDGQPYQVTELHDLVFDGPLNDGLFVFVPPEGVVVRSASESFPRPEPLSIEEAAVRAPFTVLVPGRLPEGAPLEATLHPGRGPVAPSVTLTLHTPDRLHRLFLRQAAEPLPDGLDWTEVDHGGVPLVVFDAGHGVEIKRELHGTHVRVSGDFDRDTMLEIAASLRPAPTEPPRLTDATPAP